MTEAPRPPRPEDIEAIRAEFTNEVIRAIGALARQQEVCREQGGAVVFVTGMEAAREFIVEHMSAALDQVRQQLAEAREERDRLEPVDEREATRSRL